MPRGRSKAKKPQQDDVLPAAENEDVFEAFSDEEPTTAAAKEDVPMGEASDEDADSSDDPSDDSSVESNEADHAGPEAKDDTELELEKLVFGDAAGFREAVSGFKADDEAQHGDMERDDLANVNDEDLFFLDAAPGGTQASLDLQKQNEEDELVSRAPPAWEDSDDERLSISLMAVPRLRKLRNFEGEDIISGKEYIRRLRRQYEVLHPRPAWASWRPQERPAKRRRLSEDASGSDANADDMDVDDDITPQQPLAKLLRSAAPLTRASNSTSPYTGIPILAPETISIRRLPDIAPTQPHAIASLSIHPTLPLLLTAGLSSTMYLHHLLPNPVAPSPQNPLLTTLSLRHTPLTTAAFSPHANTPTEPKIYLSSPRRYFHTWTLPSGQITKTTRIYGEQRSSQQKITTLKPSPCGRYLGLLGTSKKGAGVVNVLSAATSQWLAQARTEGRGGLAGFAWWGDGEGMSMLSKGGEVTEWSVPERRVVWRWFDEGAVNATVIALGAGAGPGSRSRRAKTKAKAITQQSKSLGTNGAADDDDQDEDQHPPHLGPDAHTIIGQSSGMVTIYSRASFLTASNPTPLRTLSHLTTPISLLALSPDGQLLVMASRWKRDALRLVHLPSCAVYRNWPTAKTPFGRVSGAAVGVVDGEEEGVRKLMLVVGNEAGALRCWEVGGQ